jgi:hypothetical protein
VRGRDAGLTLHAVTSVTRLRELGRTMDNCLASYGDRLRGRHRIVEARRDGEVRYAIHLEGGRIITFEAPGNRRPDPADVPVVRRLLEEGGHLADSARAGAREAPRRPPGQLALPTAWDDPPTAQHPTTPGSPRAPSSTPPARPIRPPPPPGVSLQALAAGHLGPVTLESPDWTEVAAALWAVGLLPRLPSPRQVTFERIVRDLAGRVAVGGDAGLPRRPPPDETARAEARRRLLDGDDGEGGEGWQRRRMAAILAVPVRP